VTSICSCEDVRFDLAASEPVKSDVQVHVDERTSCRRRIDELRARLSRLRDLWKRDTEGHHKPAASVSRPAQVGKYPIVDTLAEGAQTVSYRGLPPRSSGRSWSS
jgi:hypothetical protein